MLGPIASIALPAAAVLGSHVAVRAECSRGAPVAIITEGCGKT